MISLSPSTCSHSFQEKPLCKRPCIHWLHISASGLKKGVYIDGHESEDVVHHRKSLLKILRDLCICHRLPRASLSLFSTMSPSSISTKARHGFGRRVNGLPFSQRQRQWDYGLTSLRNMEANSGYHSRNLGIQNTLTKH